MALASPNTFGQQRVAVIMVNFQDKQTQPHAWTHAQDVTFNQTNAFFLENSYGQTSLTGDVFGWFTIAQSSTVCDYNTLAAQADQAASNAGVNLNNYSRRVYSFPANACTWWGLGTVGGNPSRAWIKGTYALKVVAHELGHNFGDFHSNSQPCELAGCSITEYGHDRDTMGGSGAGHFNAFQKERLGWLNYGSSPSIQTVTGSGTFFINSLQTPGSGLESAQDSQTASPSGNVSYFVEARTQTGFDSGFAPGVLVSSGNDANGDSSYQVDLDPVTSGFDRTLDPGQSFTDAAAGLTITTLSLEAGGAWVQIEYAGQPCSERAPTVTLSPGGTMTTQPGVPVNYTLTVASNDDSSCAASDFSVAMDCAGRILVDVGSRIGQRRPWWIGQREHRGHTTDDGVWHVDVARPGVPRRRPRCLVAQRISQCPGADHVDRGQPGHRKEQFAVHHDQHGDGQRLAGFRCTGHLQNHQPERCGDDDAGNDGEQWHRASQAADEGQGPEGRLHGQRHGDVERPLSDGGRELQLLANESPRGRRLRRDNRSKTQAARLAIPQAGRCVLRNSRATGGESLDLAAAQPRSKRDEAGAEQQKGRGLRRHRAAFFTFKLRDVRVAAAPQEEVREAAARTQGCWYSKAPPSPPGMTSNRNQSGFET